MSKVVYLHSQNVLRLLFQTKHISFYTMIIVNIKDNEPLDKALKRFKKKFEKTGVLREVRSRGAFEKRSVRKRNTKLRAIYRQKVTLQENI